MNMEFIGVILSSTNILYSHSRKRGYTAYIDYKWKYKKQTFVKSTNIFCNLSK